MVPTLSQGRGREEGRLEEGEQPPSAGSELSILRRNGNAQIVSFCRGEWKLYFASSAYRNLLFFVFVSSSTVQAGRAGKQRANKIKARNRRFYVVRVRW